jgi:hydrogenase nickel incorporation protein HypA/HybF
VHELSLSAGIVDTVERHAAGRRVTLVSLRIGTLRQVVPESLAFYFEIVSRDTVCEGARLEHELVRALLHCRECEREWDPEPAPLATHSSAIGGLPELPSFRCPDCGSGSAEIRSGGEFEVESIEVETSGKEEECIAPG